MSPEMLVWAVPALLLGAAGGYSIGVAAAHKRLYSQADMTEARLVTRKEATKFYQKVLDNLHRNGTLPPSCDLRMPKATLTLSDSKSGIVAKGGKWLRLPLDNELLLVQYEAQDGDPAVTALLQRMTEYAVRSPEGPVYVSVEDFQAYSELVRSGGTPLYKDREVRPDGGGA